MREFDGEFGAGLMIDAVFLAGGAMSRRKHQEADKLRRISSCPVLEFLHGLSLLSGNPVSFIGGTMAVGGDDSLPSMDDWVPASCGNDGYNSSFSSVSVRCRRAFSFKRRLTDTCVLGKNPPGADFRVARRARIRDDTRNLPKTGTGFGKVHASLREIPEGDEKYSRWRSLFFYHSRMTEWWGLLIFRRSRMTGVGVIFPQ